MKVKTKTNITDTPRCPQRFKADALQGIGCGERHRHHHDERRPGGPFEPLHHDECGVEGDRHDRRLGEVEETRHLEHQREGDREQHVVGGGRKRRPKDLQDDGDVLHGSVATPSTCAPVESLFADDGLARPFPAFDFHQVDRFCRRVVFADRGLAGQRQCRTLFIASISLRKFSPVIGSFLSSSDFSTAATRYGAS